MDAAGKGFNPEFSDFLFYFGTQRVVEPRSNFFSLQVLRNRINGAGMGLALLLELPFAFRAGPELFCFFGGRHDSE
jgi:hypothetical protein